MNLSVVNQTTLSNISAKTAITPIGEVLPKLFEEAGEVSAEYLAFTNSVNASSSAEGTAEALAEEAVDVLIVAHDLVSTIQKLTGLSDKHVQEVMQRKLSKWESKL